MRKKPESLLVGSLGKVLHGTSSILRGRQVAELRNLFVLVAQSNGTKHDLICIYSIKQKSSFCA